MFRFQTTRKVPPKGFHYIDHDTGHEIFGRNYDVWIGQINGHRSSNGLTPVDPADIEDQCCRRLDAAGVQRFCMSDTPEITVDSVSMNLGDVMRGTAAFVLFKTSGAQLVDESEMEHRKETCATCPFRVSFKRPCAGLCEQLKSMMQDAVGVRSPVDFPDGRTACGVCKCMLPVKLWFPLSVIHQVDTERIQSLYPQNCWAKPQA